MQILMDELKRRWREGHPPDAAELRQFVDSIEAEHLTEILLVDQFHRWRTFGSSPLSDYIRYLQDRAASDDHVLMLLEEEYGYRTEYRDGPQLPEFISDCERLTPHLVADIRLRIQSEDDKAFVESVSRGQHSTDARDQEHAESGGLRCTHHRIACGEIKTLSEGRYEIVRPLGHGSFSVVYLGRDTVLQRDVAIKIPSREIVKLAGGLQNITKEAQAIAGLDHPGIVPVFDVGVLDDDSLFIVSKFVGGETLQKRLVNNKLEPIQAAQLIAAIADALHAAHENGLVHRDIKPANILIDAEMRPHLVDFGLAIRPEEAQVRSLVGTPAYMSPEQARGESHRVTRQSDIYSLGVIFYELLSGERPHAAETREELLKQVQQHAGRRLGKMDGTLPANLLRICHRAIASRAADRYPTAQAFAADLRQFFQDQTESTPASVASSSADTLPIKTPETRIIDMNDAEAGCAGIIPKGLRAFDESDADFYLELLPGPKDKDGYPSLIRFWKQKLEASGSAESSPVGLIYGPSGCGKSSIIRAGLIPRLASHVDVVFAEASADGTEQVLLRNLKRVIPDLPHDVSLHDALLLARSRPRPGRKLVLIIDQFEQWLHRWNGSSNAQMVEALRQCDGEHVQALLLVRDDFWMAVSRFMRELEIRLVEDENCRAVDLFDERHARRVLAALGLAYGTLQLRPEISSLEYSVLDIMSVIPDESQKFIESTVEAISENGRVLPVRLSLLAQMLQRRDWKLETLKALGGVTGVGFAFLEETFGRSAPPRYRIHSEAAEKLLAALLPSGNVDIRSQVRTRSYLLRASGYSKQQAQFADLLELLDKNLRLITPVESAPVVNPQSARRESSKAGEYQLTHDYLVPALRRWLSRRQLANPAGRAQLKLKSFAESWEQQPNWRSLPTPLEYFAIRLRTDRHSWSAGESAMMRTATRNYSVLLVLLITTFLCGSGLYFELNGRWAARQLRDQIVVAELSDLPTLTAESKAIRRWAYPLLRDELDRPDISAHAKLNLGLTLHESDPSRSVGLIYHLLESSPEDLPVFGELLASQPEAVIESLEKRLSNSQGREQLNCASLLCLLKAAPTLSPTTASQLVDQLVKEDDAADDYIEMLAPVSHSLKPFLEGKYRIRRPLQRLVAARALVRYFTGEAPELVGLIEDANEDQMAILTTLIQRHQDELFKPLIQRLNLVRYPAWQEETNVEPNQEIPDLDTETQELIQQAAGAIDAHSAYCLALPIEQIETLVTTLKAHGYRPTRLRPYTSATGILVAACWARDARQWDWIISATREEVEERIEQNQHLVPQDVAGYCLPDQSEPRFSFIWEAPKFTGEQREAYLGLADDESIPKHLQYELQGYHEFSRHVFVDQDGRDYRRSMIWGMDPAHIADCYFDQVSERGIQPLSSSLECPVDICIFRPSASERVPRLQYSGIWLTQDRMFDRRALVGVTFDEHQEQAAQLIRSGYRPTSISAIAAPDSRRVAASVWIRPHVSDGQNGTYARQQANIATVLCRLGDWESVLPLLEDSTDPTIRTEIIHRLRPNQCNVSSVWDQVERATSPAIKQALLLAIGEYPQSNVNFWTRRKILEGVSEIAASSPEARIQAAATWVLRAWELPREVIEEHNRMTPTAGASEAFDSNWFDDPLGQRMVIVDLSNSQFPSMIGCYESENGSTWDENIHAKWIKRCFAIGAYEVSVGEFRRFVDENPGTSFAFREGEWDDMPATRVSWYLAAQYCNWLSQQIGLPEEEWCYKIEVDEQGDWHFELADDYLSRTGYRLPTEAEWEYSCRANSRTVRPHGTTYSRTEEYSWFHRNSGNKLARRGLLKPNDLGLFDMLGNAREWCQERTSSDVARVRFLVNSDLEDAPAVELDESRVTKGGAFDEIAIQLRSANRTGIYPHQRLETVGFRVARTMVKGPSSGPIELGARGNDSRPVRHELKLRP